MLRRGKMLLYVLFRHISILILLIKGLNILGFSAIEMAWMKNRVAELFTTNTGCRIVYNRHRMPNCLQPTQDDAEFYADRG